MKRWLRQNFVIMMPGVVEFPSYGRLASAV